MNPIATLAQASGIFLLAAAGVSAATPQSVKIPLEVVHDEEGRNRVDETRVVQDINVGLIPYFHADVMCDLENGVMRLRPLP